MKVKSIIEVTITVVVVLGLIDMSAIVDNIKDILKKYVKNRKS